MPQEQAAGASPPNPLERPYRSRYAAAILAVFVGIFGLHRFYLGQWWGVFYLLFFWTLIPGLVAFIEAIVFLASDHMAWNRKYNPGIETGPPSAGMIVVAVFALIIGSGAGLMLPGIVAAVAIPAYQDYVARATVEQSVKDLEPVREAVADFVDRTGRLPESLDSSDIPAPDSKFVDRVTVVDNRLRVTLGLGAGPVARKTFDMVPVRETGGGVRWVCRTDTLDADQLPAHCRQ